MICKICNAEIPEGAKNCFKCGNDTEITKRFSCVNCGEQMMADLDFEMLVELKRKRRKIKSNQIINLLPDWHH